MENSEDCFIQQINNDDFYSTYLGVDQNSHFLQMQALTIGEQVRKLGEGIDSINQELQKQVLEKHDDLLKHASHATKLENVVNIMNEHAQNLLANAERLKSQITTPYKALETHTNVLKRLHLASHILRQVNRIQHLSTRLSNTSDPIQKATILYELEQLASDEDLKDIDVVTSELRNIRVQQQKVVNLAIGSLNQGIVNENVPQATTALQIFLNLNIIDSSLQNIIDTSLADCKDSLKHAFDLANASSANTSSGGRSGSKGPGRVTLTSSQNFRNKMWLEIEKAFGEEIHQQCKQIKFLQTSVDDGLKNAIAANKNNQSFSLDVAGKFWTRLGQIITDEIKAAPEAVRQMLAEDYPKLLKCCYEMHDKLKYDKFVFDQQILDSIENSYLSMALTRLLEPAQAMFGIDCDVPSHDQIDSLLRVITSELSVALIDEHLSEKICRNVSKCIKMYAVKTEQQLETGPESVQVIGGTANSGQQRNVQHANSLYYLRVQIQRILFNMRDTLPETGVSLINESLDVVSGLIGAVMLPIVVSIKSTIETIIETIHLETDWNRTQHVSSNKSMVGCSPYMRELSQFINRVYHTYLANFDDKEALLSNCSDIAIRCIELFVRHVSLLRPLSATGRQRLHADFVHLEQHCLRVICPHLNDLGRPYRLLKSMASLVISSPEKILASQASESSVPHSTVLLMLFSFAGSELASPHQNTGWSIPKLSSWLDEHPKESDKLDLIAGALQRYESLVRQKNSMNYDPVYPIMSQLLESAVKTLKD